MFPSPSGDKENVLGEVLLPTPRRKPLKVVSGNLAPDGTPLSMTKRTPKPRSTRASTPSSRRLARRLKRQSVPFSLSKPLSIFEDDSNTRGIFKEKLDVEESLYMKRNDQELNEMIRDKVSETVIKLKERYEATLAEKDRDLDEKNSTIEKLQSEMDMLKQSKTDSGQSQKDIQDQNVSLFVKEIISKAIYDIEHEKSLSSTQTDGKNPDSFAFSPQNTTAKTKKDSCTSITPKNYVSAENSEFGTSMTPVLKTHSAVSVTPIQTADAMVCTSPVNVKDAVLSTSPTNVTNSSTSTSPVCLINSTVSSNLGTITDKVLHTPTKTESELEPKVLNVSEAEHFLTPTQEHNTEPTVIHETVGNVVNTTIKESCIDAETSMTPVELVDKHTNVSPILTSNASVCTSPLVAVLQPEIISSLPLNRLKAELESAAISNELLRSECDELNGKIEELQSSLNEATKETEKKCKILQDEVDSLERKLEEALEINYQMEMKKPFTVEEYDETISRLQKDILLKEKQITFYTKKASEADNLQKDLRRMYAKYNTEHQLYTKLDEEAKVLTEQYNTKCIENESLQSELRDVKEQLEKAHWTIDEQDKVREQAKESQVRCYTLEEQIETFQSQQRENLEFLEQERKGLEETTAELEQLVQTRTEELDATRLALEEKTALHEQMRESAHKLRDQLSEVKEELVAVQSQAYLAMLEQEKELTAVSGVLEETWERLTTVVATYKEQAIVRDEPAVEPEDEERSKDDYKPSFVYSVLAAVSGTAPQSDHDVEVSRSDEDTTETKDTTQIQDTAIPNEGPCTIENESGDLCIEFTLVSRAKAFQKLLLEMENYVKDGNEHAQMVIQRQVHEIANLEESLSKAKHHCDERIKILKQELENEGCKMKKMQRDNDNKQYEIESLKLELKTVEENLETSRECMKELGNRCCTLIQQETENQVLNEQLRLVQQELEKVKQDRSCLEKELNETVDRLQRLVEASEGNDKEKQTLVLKENFTELLNKKIHLEREVEKLRSSFAKTLKENESFAQYNARLQNKASILGSNLLRAEEEIYRLDGIVDRFCTATQSCWQTTTPSQDLLDLLKELNIVVE